MTRTDDAGTTSQHDDGSSTAPRTTSTATSRQDFGGTQTDPLTLNNAHYGVRRLRLGGETYFLDTTGERPPKLFRRVAATNDPDRLNEYDGPILYDGEVVEIEDYTTYHHWMGRRGSVRLPRLRTAALLLTEVHR